MISIVICSRSNSIPLSLQRSISATIGVEYELVVVDNSKNQFSIFQAYNVGVQKAKYPYICFLHEDVEFVADYLDWGKSLIEILSHENTGVVGVAGSDIVTRIPAPWSFYRPAKKMNIIQGIKNNQGELFFEQRCLPRGNSEKCLPVILLDGVFLAMRKQLFDEIAFDEKILGFHGYDFDITLQSYFLGYQNYVMYDNIRLKHFSLGNIDKKYYENLIKVFSKYEEKLSIAVVENKKKWHNICAIERKQLRRFCLNLLKTGFSPKYVIDIFVYYSKLINLPRFKYYSLLVYFQIRCLFWK